VKWLGVFLAAVFVASVLTLALGRAADDQYDDQTDDGTGAPRVVPPRKTPPTPGATSSPVPSSPGIRPHLYLVPHESCSERRGRWQCVRQAHPHQPDHHVFRGEVG
jgi:hypothetical protein